MKKVLLVLFLCLFFVSLISVNAAEELPVVEESFDWIAFGTRVIEFIIASLPQLVIIAGALATIRKRNATIPEILSQTKNAILTQSETKITDIAKTILESNAKNSEKFSALESKISDSDKKVEVLLKENKELLSIINILVSRDSDLVKTGKATKVIQEVNKDEKLQIKE